MSETLAFIAPLWIILLVGIPVHTRVCTPLPGVMKTSPPIVMSTTALGMTMALRFSVVVLGLISTASRGMYISSIAGIERCLIVLFELGRFFY